MAEKNKVVCFVVSVVLCVLISCTVTGCSSTKFTDRDVLEHQRELDEYKATVDGYIQRIDKSVGRIESIRERAESLGGTIDETIDLFDEYQRAVELMLQDYNDLRREIESGKKTSPNSDDNIHSTDSGKNTGSGIKD